MFKTTSAHKTSKQEIIALSRDIKNGPNILNKQAIPKKRNGLFKMNK
jgi:hypothetical protein